MPCIIGDVGTDGGDADGAVVVVVVVVVAVTDWTKTGTLIEGDTIVALFADDVLEEADFSEEDLDQVRKRLNSVLDEIVTKGIEK